MKAVPFIADALWWDGLEAYMQDCLKSTTSIIPQKLRYLAKWMIKHLLCFADIDCAVSAKQEVFGCTLENFLQKHIKVMGSFRVCDRWGRRS